MLKKKYQTQLTKQSEFLFELYKNLPTNSKIELLFHSENIAHINHHVRMHAKAQLLAAQEKAIAVQQEASARLAARVHKTETLHQKNISKDKTIEANAPQATINKNGSPWKPKTVSEGADLIKVNLPPNNYDAIYQLLPESPLNKQTYPRQSISQVSKAKASDHVDLGNPLATTINFPVHRIPGFSHLNQFLSSFEKTAHLSLGLTVKLQADQLSVNGKKPDCYAYKLKYIGIGPMSNTNFNVQLSPVAAEYNYGVNETGFAFNSTAFQAPLKHPSVGLKGTINADSEYFSSGIAPEISYVRNRRSKVSYLTTNTLGYNFGNSARLFHIPHIEIPSLQNIKDSLPSKEELAFIEKKIAPVVGIPIAITNPKTLALPALELYDSTVKLGADFVQKSLMQVENLISNLSQDHQKIVRSQIYENSLKHFNHDTLNNAQSYYNTNSLETTQATTP